MSDPNIKAVDKEGEELKDVNVRVNGLIPGVGGDTISSISELTDVNIEGFIADTKANRPDPGTANLLFYATDEKQLYRDDGSSWIADKLVEQTDETTTFSESDVSTTLNSIATNSNDDLELAVGTTTGSTATRNSDDSSFSASYTEEGMLINPNNDLKGIEFNISSNTSGLTDVYLETGDGGGTQLDHTTDISSPIRLEADLTAGNRYFIKGNAGGSSFTIGYYGAGQSLPVTSTDVDIVGSVNNGSVADGSEASMYLFNDITALVPDEATSGDALIQWDGGVPSNISEWSMADLRKTLDGETVTFDVEDGNGNVIYTDVQNNIDLSQIDPSKDIRIRARLSRSDTSNNPTVQKVSRHWME